MIGVNDGNGRSSINPRMVELVDENDDGVFMWIGECRYSVSISYVEAVEAVDRANS